MQIVESLPVEAVLNAATQIERRAYEADDVYYNCIPVELVRGKGENGYLWLLEHHVALSRPHVWESLKATYRRHRPSIVSSNDRIKELEWEGTKLYAEAVLHAHTIYATWPKPKQVRAERQLRLIMSGGYPPHYQDVRTGLFNPTTPMNYFELLAATSGLRALADENRNTDETDPYWERIKDAVIIEPRPGYMIPIHLNREDRYGSWEWDYRFDECIGARTTTDIESLIESLVGEKVIFYPLDTKAAAVAFRDARYANAELPFAFGVRVLNEDGGQIGEAIGKVVSEEFNPFGKSDSEQVVEFFRRHISLDVV